MPNGVPYCTGYKDTPAPGPAVVSITDTPRIVRDLAAKVGTTEQTVYYNAYTPTSSIIKADGTLWLWGCNDNGQLGNDNTIDRSSPVQTVSTGTNWRQASVGIVSGAPNTGFTSAIKTDGTLWTWGRNSAGVLGNNFSGQFNRQSPIQTIAQGNNWCQVSSGSAFIAAIKTDGTLWTWGCNSNGTLGNNDTINRSSPIQTITQGTNWKQVSVYTNVVGAIKTDGTLWTWGLGGSGQLGNNRAVNQSSPVQTVSTGTNWKQVSATGTNISAIKTDGTLWLWGYNLSGELGDNTAIYRSSPVQTVSTGTNWKDTCGSAAVKTDGTLWVWSSVGLSYTASSPVQIATSKTDWTGVTTGGSSGYVFGDLNGRLYALGTQTCQFQEFGPIYDTVASDLGTQLIEKDYLMEVYPNLIPTVKAPALYVWGSNNFGELGTNDTLDRSTPTQTACQGINWKQVSASLYSAAIKTDGTLWLWGCNSFGQLGNNNTIDRSVPVQTVTTGTNWKQISTGSVIAAYDGFSSAVKTDGTLWLWGYNQSGELGNNTTINRSSPVQTVSTGTNWKQVSSGESATAAVKTDGTLWLWGRNANGQLGNNDIISRSSPVQTVSTGTNWKQVSAGSLSTAAIKNDGTLWTWGEGRCGQLGLQNRNSQSSPVQTISSGTNWKKVTMGNSVEITAAIKTDGTLWLWGENLYGTLATNNTINYSSPVQTIAQGVTWRDVDVGGLLIPLTAAIKTDGTLWLWGRNQSYGLGTGNTIARSSPVQTIIQGTNWKSVDVGENHTLAINDEFGL